MAPVDAPRVLAVLGNLALHGQERGNIQVFRALQQAGVEPLVATHALWGHLHVQPYLDALGLAWTPVPYARHFTKRTPLAEWPRNLRRLMEGSGAFTRAMRDYRPTHIHVANPHYFLCVLPALLRVRTPVVYRLGDVPGMHHPLYRALWKGVILRRVSTFVCISEFVRERLVEIGAPRERTRVIYSTPPERPPPTQRCEVPSFEGRTIVYVGQITEKKGVDKLVAAAMALCRERDDVRFLIAGAVDRQNPFALALLAGVAQAGLAERIRFLGYVEDVPGLLAAADLHVCPSVCQEALGNVVLEAKQAGVPSLVFPSGGLPELIRDGEDGVICPEPTLPTLTAALRDILTLDRGALATRGKAARRSLTSLGADPDTFTRAWADVYGAAVPDPSPVGP